MIVQARVMSRPRLSFENMREAAQRIDPVFLNSPQFVCDTLSRSLAVRTVVKIETINPVRSFKGRGADYLLTTLPIGTDLVVASTGNLGQALAYSCRKRQASLTVFSAESASAYKIECMREFGAKVVLHGHDFDAAKEEARRFARDTGRLFVEDGREPRLTEGAATIAQELLRIPERLDAIVVALGNGAMLAGIAHWFKMASARAQVIGVAATGAPCMELSFRRRRPVQLPAVHTIADGMATRTPIAEALDDMLGAVDDVLLVSDDAMLRGMRLAYRDLGIVLEPSGAAGLAALLEHRELFEGRTVATVLCGGNLSDDQRRMWLGDGSHHENMDRAPNGSRLW